MVMAFGNVGVFRGARFRVLGGYRFYGGLFFLIIWDFLVIGVNRVLVGFIYVGVL